MPRCQLFCFSPPLCSFSRTRVTSRFCLCVCLHVLSFSGPSASLVCRAYKFCWTSCLRFALLPFVCVSYLSVCVRFAHARFAFSPARSLRVLRSPRATFHVALFVALPRVLFLPLWIAFCILVRLFSFVHTALPFSPFHLPAVLWVTHLDRLLAFVYTLVLSDFALDAFADYVLAFAIHHSFVRMLPLSFSFIVLVWLRFRLVTMRFSALLLTRVLRDFAFRVVPSSLLRGSPVRFCGSAAFAHTDFLRSRICRFTAGHVAFWLHFTVYVWFSFTLRIFYTLIFAGWIAGSAFAASRTRLRFSRFTRCPTHARVCSFRAAVCHSLLTHLASLRGLLTAVTRGFRSALPLSRCRFRITFTQAVTVYARSHVYTRLPRCARVTLPFTSFTRALPRLDSFRVYILTL